MTAYSYSPALKAAAKVGDWQTAMAAIDLMTRAAQGKESDAGPDLVCYNYAMSACVKAGECEVSFNRSRLCCSSSSSAAAAAALLLRLIFLILTVLFLRVYVHHFCVRCSCGACVCALYKGLGMIPVTCFVSSKKKKNSMAGT